MTTYTTLTDAALSQDKPVTQSMTRAWRDNPLAISEGDASAPRVLAPALGFPYFKAARTTNQTGSPGSSVFNKLTANTELNDPYNLYDNATNYRFTPNQAGVYLCGVDILVTAGLSASTAYLAGVGKNGSVSDSNQGPKSTDANGNGSLVSHTCIVTLNGTTDYIEAFWGQVGSAASSMTVQGKFWAMAMGRIS